MDCNPCKRKHHDHGPRAADGLGGGRAADKVSSRGGVRARVIGLGAEEEERVAAAVQALVFLGGDVLLLVPGPPGPGEILFLGFFSGPLR